MKSTFEVVSRPATVQVDREKLRAGLNKALPFYLLYTNQMFTEPLINDVEATIDGEVGTCRIVGLVGDSEEPLLVILYRVYDGQLNTFVVLEYIESVDDNPEEYTHGSLEPRQVVYAVDGYDSYKADHTIRLVRSLI